MGFSRGLCLGCSLFCWHVFRLRYAPSLCGGLYIWWDPCLECRRYFRCCMGFECITEFGVRIMLFNCLDVRGSFSFEYDLCLGCNL
jgi:hypothetical protein